jgi:methionyl-tRNA synthetase
MFVTEKDLVNGECPYHPGQKLETIEEENYFFKYSAFQGELSRVYNSEFVVPSSRQNEIKSFVLGGLEDFSISRLKSKMPWGIPVPGDDEHVMYVWFDALTNYITTLGWPNDMEKFEKFWETVKGIAQTTIPQSEKVSKRSNTHLATQLVC